MKNTLLLLFLFLAYFTNGQTIFTNKMPEYRYQYKFSVGIPNATALPTSVDFAVGDSATTRAMFIPRVQTTAAITTPRQGMVVYSISDSSFYYRSLYGWRKGVTTSSVINDLSDVNTTGVVSGDYLRYNPSGEWVDSTVTIPTWQQVLTAGSTLTQDNTVVNNANTLLITGNTVAGDPILSITSTSTAAASNLQKGINVSLSGANATSSQITYGGYISNTHGGTGAINYGIYSFVDATQSNSSTGLFGESNQSGVGTTGKTADGNGVYGLATGGGTGVYGTSATGGGVWGDAQAGGNGVLGTSLSGLGLAGQTNPSSTNTSVPVMQLTRLTSGTAADGIGGYINLVVETSTGAQQISNQLISKWTTAANATRTSQFIISGVSNAVTGDIISFEGNKRTMFYGRLEMQQGADVASAAGAIAVGLDGNVFELTGTDAITLISNLNFVNGSVIYLLFTSTATLTDGTANSGTDIGMELLGNANFVGSADDVVTLVLGEIGGTQRWRMVSSSVN